MGVLQNIAGLALRQVVDWACDAVGVKDSGAVVGFLADHFRDHAAKLQKALETANERTWTALEVALAGDSWWERVQVALARGEDQAFRRQVREFLAAAPLGDGPAADGAFRRDCLRELRAARKAGLLSAGVLDPGDLARRAGAFAARHDPTALLDAEWEAVRGTAGALREAGCPSLARLLDARPARGVPLPVAAAATSSAARSRPTPNSSAA